MDVKAFFHYVTFSEKQEINDALGNFLEDTSHDILFYMTIEIVAWKKTRCIEGCSVFFLAWRNGSKWENLDTPKAIDVCRPPFVFSVLFFVLILVLFA